MPAPHAPVQRNRPVVVLIDRKIRYPPDALAQDPHDGTDVEKLHAAAGGPHVHDGQSGSIRGGGFHLWIPAVPLLLTWANKELDQL